MKITFHYYSQLYLTKVLHRFVASVTVNYSERKEKLLAKYITLLSKYQNKSKFTHDD